MQKFTVKVLKITLLTIVGLMFLSNLNNSILEKISVISETSDIYINPKSSQSIIDFKLNENEISIIGTSRVSGFEKNMFRNKRIFNDCKLS